jgi:hypothetical protein
VHASVLAAALAGAACGGSGPAPEPGAPQPGPDPQAAPAPPIPAPGATEDSSMTSHPFKLQGDEYWTDPFKNAMDLQDATIGEGKTALLIDAPPLVDSGIHQTIPVLVYTCMTQKD